MSETRFQRAIERFDAINAEDPSTLTVDGVPEPRELVQAKRLARWVEILDPAASEPLRLAARCQHIGRFKVPRATYPNDRLGYLKWRTELGRFHADTAAHILREVGYDTETIERVQRIVRKQGLTTDADVQTMEDALCLSFLEHEFSEFADKHDDDKLMAIVSKTWRKMSAKARTYALAVPLGGRPRALVERAVAAKGFAGE